MTRLKRIALPLFAVAAGSLAGGCGSQATGQLSAAQTDYYKKLSATLSANRALYATGVAGTADVEARQLAVRANWAAAVRRAALLLQSSGNPDGRTDLLLTQLADLSLADGSRLDAARAGAKARADELTAAYDALVAAADALRTNSAGLTGFLTDSSGKSALQSLDVAGLTRAASLVRDARQLIRDGKVRSDARRQAEDDRLQKQIDQARDVLVKLASQKP